MYFYLQIPALVKFELKSKENIRLPPRLLHRQQESNSADSPRTKPEGEQESFFLQIAREACSAIQLHTVAPRQGKG